MGLVRSRFRRIAAAGALLLLMLLAIPAVASAHSASSPNGSTTSWIQRGTTTGATGTTPWGRGELGGGSSTLGAGSSGAARRSRSPSVGSVSAASDALPPERLGNLRAIQLEV